jgi:hypothetical protein
VRTTLTLEDDVRAGLDREVRRSGKPFKEVVNHFLRVGLNSRTAAKPARPFVVRARSMGLEPGLSLDSVADLIEQLEGPLGR